MDRKIHFEFFADLSVLRCPESKVIFQNWYVDHMFELFLKFVDNSKFGVPATRRKHKVRIYQNQL